MVMALDAEAPTLDSRNTRIPGPHSRLPLPEAGERKAWETRKSLLRRQILSAAGLLPMPERTALKPRIVRTLDRDGYSIETLLIETLPGYYLGGNLYRPSAPKGKLPAVLSPHGHWKHGRVEHRKDYSVPALGVNLARQGYVVFAYDMVGYNDTRQTPHEFGGWRERLWSFNPMGLQLWNSIRSLDFLESLDYVDPERIAVTGASGGATQTFLLAAVDGRVRAGAPVNMISATMQGGDPCEEAPNLRLDTSNVEIAALMAPRPMLVVSCTRDWTRRTPNVEFPAIQRIYEMYGKPDSVRNVHLDARHNYNGDSREAVYAFLARHLSPGLGPADLKDLEIQPERDADLLAFRPPDALSYEQLFEQWRETARVQTSRTQDLTALRERFTAALGAEWPEHVSSDVRGDEVVLARPLSGDRLRGLWFPGKGDPVLAVDPGGAEAAVEHPSIQKLIRGGHAVLAIDAFQTGTARARRNRSRKYFLSYNQTDDANRVQDVLTALAFLKTQSRGMPRVIGFEKAAIWSLFAAAVAPVEVRLTADLKDFHGEDEDFRHRFFVPGIQRAGGLEAALKLVKFY